MTDIKRLFFDLGSTLVDETECVKKRCDVIIENNGKLYPIEIKNVCRSRRPRMASCKCYAICSLCKYN